MPDITIASYHARKLADLQTALRNQLYIRPPDIKALESAAVDLCDSLYAALEEDHNHKFKKMPEFPTMVECRICGLIKSKST